MQMKRHAKVKMTKPSVNRKIGPTKIVIVIEYSMHHEKFIEAAQSFNDLNRNNLSA